MSVIINGIDLLQAHPTAMVIEIMESGTKTKADTLGTMHVNVDGKLIKKKRVYWFIPYDTEPSSIKDVLINANWKWY